MTFPKKKNIPTPKKYQFKNVDRGTCSSFYLFLLKSVISWKIDILRNKSKADVYKWPAEINKINPKSMAAPESVLVMTDLILADLDKGLAGSALPLY